MRYFRENGTQYPMIYRSSDGYSVEFLGYDNEWAWSGLTVPALLGDELDFSEISESEVPTYDRQGNPL